MAGKKDKDAELAEQFRKLGQLLGKTYGAKGAKTTNKKLTKEQREERARQGGLASSKALTKKERQERAREAVKERWRKWREAQKEKEAE